MNTKIRIEICPNCLGTGKIRPRQHLVQTSLYDSDWVQDQDYECPKCQGSGRVVATITPYVEDKVFDLNYQEVSQK